VDVLGTDDQDVGMTLHGGFLEPQCDSVIILLDARTNYKPDAQAGWRGQDPLPRILEEAKTDRQEGDRAPGCGDDPGTDRRTGTRGTASAPAGILVRAAIGGDPDDLLIADHRVAPPTFRNGSTTRHAHMKTTSWMVMPIIYNHVRQFSRSADACIHHARPTRNA